jgi:regulator of protease activity HflC (stomatin/prohibitin superfamily)
MLVPEIGSSARLLISRYTAEEFYTAYRLQVQDEIHKQIVQRLLTENSYSVANVTLIELDEVMIRSIVLPERVATAIERKIEQYQQNLEYDFRLVTEDKEARRKEIEGAGVRAMFDRIGPADVNNYLRLAGIQATLQLAASPNAKVVVVGNGGTAGGLPLLLGDINSSPAPAAAASAARQPGTRPLASLGSAAMRPLQIPVPAASEVPRAQTPTAAAPAVPAATRP